MANTRILLGTLALRTGARLFSNWRRPLLVWVEDTGVAHDLLLPAGGSADRTETSAALARLGVSPARLPDPLNLFLGTEIHEDGRIEVLPPARAGQSVTMRGTTGLACALVAWPIARGKTKEGALSVSVRNLLTGLGSS